MRKSALFAILSATACTGTLDVDDTPLPPSTEVQVTVRDGSSPQAGVLVIFESRSGALTELRTDATGAARMDLAEGGNLTVVRTYPTPVGEEPIPSEVYTYLDIKAGDNLVVGKRVADQGPAGAVLVKVPALAAGTVVVQTPCGGGQGAGPLVAITVRDCAGTVGVYGVDGNQQSFFKRVPYAETMDVSGESLVDRLASTVSAVNAVANTTVNVEQRLGSEGFDFYSTGAKRVDQAPATFQLPPLQGVEHLVLVTSSGNNRTQVVATRTLFSQPLQSVDASVGLIASVTNLQRTGTRLSWIEDGAGSADLVIASLSVTRPNGGVEQKFVHHVVAPYASASLQVPTLRGAAGTYNLIADDQIGTALAIAKVTGGYDGIRGRAFSAGRLVDATPLGGQITISYTGNAPGR